ncbi:MAG: dynamin family protein [Anaerolineae bacterium]|nr:dynamin family protein [Anaerolineae bacterium]
MFFLLVVVGEFNAGKSTFINALLGDALLPTGVTPTTAMIEVVRYGRAKSKKPEAEDDTVREWRHPNTGGEGIAIVDTPGSGSVFQRHEQTAKAFLHRADLVIFVISAKRAFAETERLYLELAKSFGKKVILVVNQVDLLDARERGEVEAFVRRQVQELLDLEPPLFMVSAKDALSRQGRRGNDTGVEHVRNHLNRSFMQVPPAKQKLLAQLALAAQMAGKYRAKVNHRLRLIGDDATQAEEVRRELETHADLLYEQRDATLAEIIRVFENLRTRGGRFIDENLRLTRVGRALDRERLRREFEEEVVGQAVDAISAASNSYVNALVDGSRLYWRRILDRLNRLDALVEAEIGAVDAGVYADQRAALQQAIYQAEAALKAYSDATIAEELRGQFRGNLLGLATSASVALAGVLTVLLASAPATAGALSGLGIVLGPVAFLAGGAAAAVFLRRLTADAKRDLGRRIDALEVTYRRTLGDLTERERSRLFAIWAAGPCARAESAPGAGGALPPAGGDAGGVRRGNRPPARRGRAGRVGAAPTFTGPAAT